MEQSFEERRDSPRSKRIVTVRHRLHKRGSKKINAMWMLSTTENMSASGLLFVSASDYKAGDLIELQVVMSGILDLFNGYGKVVRVEKGKKNLKIAIKYVELKLKKRPAKSLLPAKEHSSSA